MKSDLKEVIGDYHSFLEDLFKRLEDIELDVSSYYLDHICYRVDSNENYHFKKNQLHEFGTLLTESNINGRAISTFKLKVPIDFKDRHIELIELPAPKNAHPYPCGLEHVEFVTKESLQSLVKRYPQYAFETFGIHKKINADITLKLGPYCIRFHNQSLEDVINLEKKHGRSKNN